MKKKLFVLGEILVFLFMLCACTEKKNDRDEELPELVIGGSFYEPYFYRDISGTFVGIDAELAEEACRRIGCRPVFEEVELEKRDRLLSEGAIDCIWCCFTMDDREEKYQWAGPYLYTRRVFVVKKDSDIMQLSDLEGRTIALQAGSTSENIILRETDPDIPKLTDINTFRTMGEVFTDLRKGYAEAIVGHEAALLIYTGEYPDTYRYLPMTVHRGRLGVAFSREADPEVVEALDGALKEMTEDGTTAQIIAGYGLDVEQNLYGGSR